MKNKKTKSSARKIASITEKSATPAANLFSTRTPRHVQEQTGGGETHQKPKSPEAFLSTNQGLPISDNQNSLKAGKRGPTLLEDFILREKTHILITSAFLSASSMRVAWVRMATFSRTNP
jgi:hypothetical protein